MGLPATMTHTPTATPATATQQATFAGGCFWCIEAAFNQLQGVLQAESGYANGDHPNPTYDDICQGDTGHAEVVQVTFDPAVVSYRQLLEVFFALHDPTTLNRQGNDVGTQYRSGIYTHNAEQAHEARELLEELATAKVFSQPVVTEVAPLRNYHPAEGYHQGYALQNPGQGYCAYVVAPKLAKFRRTFAELLKAPGG
jgi:peptide-methionine (S)-S-oxide reductase